MQLINQASFYRLVMYVLKQISVLLFLEAFSGLHFMEECSSWRQPNNKYLNRLARSRAYLQHLIKYSC